MSGGLALLFLSTTCPVCQTLADSIGQAAKPLARAIAVVCIGGEKELADLSRRLGAKVPQIADGAQEIASLYRISGFPTAVLIGDDRKIQDYQHPASIEDLRRLCGGRTNINSQTGELAAQPVSMI